MDKNNYSVDEFSIHDSDQVPRFLKISTKEQLENHVEQIIQTTGLHNHRDIILEGAVLSVFPNTKPEIEHKINGTATSDNFDKWSQQPWQLYVLTAVSALCGTVQGLDETAIGGAQLFFPKYFDINHDTSHDANILGIVNSIPYLSAALIGCPLSVISNHFIGRRGTLFIASFVAGATGLWQAFSPNYRVLLGGRLIMGITLGMKSSTAPVYSAESTPTHIRGALVTLWQAFVAFGVMWGSIIGIAFLNVNPNVNWRYMLGSIFPLPMFICCFIYLVPESPRWLIKKGRFKDAFDAYKTLRGSDLIAARDFFYSYSLIIEENSIEKPFLQQFTSLFTIPRNRFAALASALLMFGLQFCGVNVLTFYISTILTDSGFSAHAALSGGCGFGALAVLGALTASILIEKRGRRFLLLLTYPILGVFLLWTGLSFYAKDEKARLGLVLTGIYIYVFMFGLGAGPVCWAYTSESGALSVRDAHSSLGSGITWLFSFVLGFTLPDMKRSIHNIGVFSFHAAWCFVLTVLIFFFVPETQGYTLEELDLIFKIPIWEHCKFQANRVKRLRFDKDEKLIDLALKFTQS